MLKMVLLITLSLMVFSCSSSKKTSTADSAKSEDSKEATKSAKTVTESTDKKGEVATTSSGSSTMGKCVLNSDERIIEIKKSGEGCEVLYTKFSETNSVASAANGMDHCQTVQDKIQSNLEHAGFNCGK